MPRDLPDVLDAFDIITGWMKSDIQCLITGRANFAGALCIIAYAEALGRFRNGTIGEGSRASRPAFRYALRHMGYSKTKAGRVYSDLRNGMAHSYFPNKEAKFVIEGEQMGSK